MNEALKLLKACRASVIWNRDRLAHMAATGKTELTQAFASDEAQQLQMLLDRMDEALLASGNRAGSGSAQVTIHGG